jgi:hypothetical protein
MSATRPPALELGSVVCMKGAGVVAGGHDGRSDSVRYRATIMGTMHLSTNSRQTFWNMCVAYSLFFSSFLLLFSSPLFFFSFLLLFSSSLFFSSFLLLFSSPLFFSSFFLLFFFSSFFLLFFSPPFFSSFLGPFSAPFFWCGVFLYFV